MALLREARRAGGLYVAYDTRVPGVPSWLQGYTRTAETISFGTGGRAVPMPLFWRDFPAGRIELGSNDEQGHRAEIHPNAPANHGNTRWHVMYFAFVAPVH